MDNRILRAIDVKKEQLYRARRAGTDVSQLSEMLNLIESACQLDDYCITMPAMAKYRKFHNDLKTWAAKVLEEEREADQRASENKG